MDLDTAADELYGVLPDDFVARRQQLVTQARAAKDRTLATAIGRLRRPTKSAWLVNRLSRENAGEVADLLTLGERLREAQSAGNGPALRRLSQQRQTAVAELVQHAAVHADGAGQPATETQRQEIAQTLQAALADAEAANLVRRGRVVQPITYGGFGVWAAAPPMGEPPAAPQPTESAATSAKQEDAAGPSAAEVQHAHDAWLAARRAVADHTAEVDRARQHLEDLRRELNELRARVADLDDERSAAEEALRAAEETLEAARDEAEERAAAYADLHPDA